MEETTIPHDVRYTREHEWVRVEGDIATIGITDYAQKQLGDIVFVELPDAGDDVGQMDEIGVIESVKAASDYFSPISGAVKEINGAIAEEPGVLNKDPYGDGWLVKISVTDDAELQDLLTDEEYKALLETDE